MTNSAFIILDIQNDFCHEEGVFQKNGLPPQNVKKILPNILEMIFFCKNQSIPIIATQLTVLENDKNEPIGLGVLKKIYPFLIDEGLRQNTWGHDLLDEIKKVDFKIKRWTLSSFYQTELAKILSALRINHLYLSGFTTNNIVETTAREAASRNYKVTTLSDCVASYSENQHFASLINLNYFGEIVLSKNIDKNYFIGKK